MMVTILTSYLADQNLRLKNLEQNQTNQTNSLYKKVPGISKQIASNIYYHLDNCGLKYDDFGSRISMCCPIHGGDNKNACVLYHDKELDIPNWKCYSHHCEEEIGKSLYHFFKEAYYKNN